MELLTLGGLTLSGATFTRVKPLLLLAYLSLEGTKDRRYLSELFWPDAADPLNSLAAALKQLRHYAPGVVESDPARVSSAVSCDARTLLHVADAGDYAGVLELYRGCFLHGVYLPGWNAELEEWVYCTREFLAGRARSAWLCRGEERAANGDFAEAAQCAEKAYLLPGAPELEPEELTRVHTLFVTGDSPHLGRLRRDAQSFGLELSLSAQTAREQLQRQVAQTSSRQTLPLRGTSFIGRDLELVEIANQLAKPDCSLLTLTGPGGVGKTRLAVRVARDLVGRYVDGVYFVPLEALTFADQIPTSIAEGLSFTLQGSEDLLVQVTRYIGTKTMLLVLDNYEHLLEAATVVTRLLQACPNLKLLVTSRERLNLEEEWVLPVEGLAIPPKTPPLSDIGDHDALRLFEDRAKRTQLSFELTPEELPHVVSICKQVQGLPLGIELAAAWVKLLSCREIAQELERTTDFLTSSSRNVPERHKSIRAVFEGSWRLLTLKEQRILRKLSVFQGGFGREAAAEVAGATIPVLASLVDKSLLRVTMSGRYEFHPLMHQYMWTKLTRHPEKQVQILEKHGRYYLCFLRARDAELKGVRQHEGLSVIAEELANIRAAWRWAVERTQVDELRLSASLLSLFYEICGRFQEGVESFGAAVAMLEETRHCKALSHMLMHYAHHSYRLGLFTPATQAAQRGLELARASTDDELTVYNLNTLGQLAWQTGEFSVASQYLKEALTLAETRQDVVLVADLTRSIGWVENKEGNYEAAKANLQEALSLFRQLAMPHEIVNNLNALGHLHINSGHPSEAQPFFEEGLKLAQETGAQVMIPHLLSGLGLALYELGNYSEARAVLQKALQETASELAQAWVMVVLGRVATATADFTSAQNYLEQALTMSWSAKQLPEVFDALVALCELHLKQGQKLQATRILYMACSHLATTGYSRALAQRLLKKSNSLSTVTIINSNVMWDKQTLLDEVVREILN